MDRNQATGLILFAAVILVYSLFFAGSPEPAEQQTAPSQTALRPYGEEENGTESDELTDTLVDQRLQQRFGAFASLVQGEAKEVVLENQDIKVILSSKGGEIKYVELKNFKTWDQNPLVLMDDESSSLEYQLNTPQGNLSVNRLFFQVSERTADMEGAPARQVVFTANTGSGTLERIYTLPEKGFLVNHRFVTEALGNQLTDQILTINWESRLKRLEEDLEESRRKTYMNYYTADGSYDYLTTGNSEDADQVGKPLKWVAFKQRFFTSGIIAQESFMGGNVAQDTPLDESSEKNMYATLTMPLDGEVSYYFGPNNYNILRRVAPDFDKNVDMGYFFVSWVNKYIIVNLFHWLENFFDNYGVIIILIVFIIKLFLLPLTYKSYIGMAKMRVIKPEIDELKEKYGEDQAKMQQEQMKLFSKLGVSPISGCLPMVLQMPFLLAMFFFFPNSIELRQESFLWAHDLSTYDSIVRLPFTIPFYGAHVSLFTLLMTLSQLAYTHFNNQLTTAQGPMKNIGYIMPVVFMFVLNSFPAALSFYYFVSNMVTFGQQALIKQFVDDDKIRQKIEESKIKNANKKKSKFQMRLEEAMKAADTKAPDTKKKRKKH